MKYFAVLLLFISSFASAQDDGGLAHTQRCYRRLDRCVRRADTVEDFRERATFGASSCQLDLPGCIYGEGAPEVHWLLHECNTFFSICLQNHIDPFYAGMDDVDTFREVRAEYRQCVTARTSCYERADVSRPRPVYTGPTLEELRREERCHLTFSVCMDANPVLGLRDCQLSYRRCIGR